MTPNQIRELTDNKLYQLYRNCADNVQQNTPLADQARIIIGLINETWQQRLTLAKAGNYKAETPDVGVLGVLGYRVGRSGEKTLTRRRVLDFVMKETLPFIGSPAYMLEWGKPLTRGIYKKLHRVLVVFRSGCKSDERYADAVADWSDDIAYLEENWQHKVH